MAKEKVYYTQLIDEEWDLADIRSRASNKAFAKVAMLEAEIYRNKIEIATENYGPLEPEQMALILAGNKIELKIWQYIAELIEKTNKND
jgi:hypothetical protein